MSGLIQLIAGIVIMVVGIVISMQPIGSSGNIIFYGAVIFGFILFIKGIINIFGLILLEQVILNMKFHLDIL